ncbi:MAG: hypothetical protein KF875_11095 [Trueperaceae bacterium]|nr:hypothetical protein [Trueperaceae bacterium]MCO5173306.1 hypothetical protein [Trueperaceae bacterium]MCW5818755.1 hypothetical protein [Trueperaceae bacterium]
MTLLRLRALGALRSLAARPAWLVVGSGLLLGLGYAIFRGVAAGVRWLYAYPLVDRLAPVVLQRSLEGLFLMLMAAVLFSVLVASIGILYGSADLELLLAQPTGRARVFGMKVVELFVNAAGLPLLFTLPVLAGIGVALGARPLYYLVGALAASALYALPVAVGALLALVLVRVAPAGRVREVATAASVSVAAVALLGLRALRPEQLFRLGDQDTDAFERFLTSFARLDAGWLPPAWAANASWAALDGRLHAGLLVLLATGAAGLGLAGLLAHVAFARGWVRSLDAAPVAAPRRRSTAPRWERALVGRLGVTGAIIAKDARVFMRDVQQWSQLIVLAALAGVYFVSLAAIPVPTQQFRDGLGAMNIAFVGFIVAGIGLRVAYPSVSFDDGAFWLSQVQPIRKRTVVLAKFLFTLPLMLALALGLGITAGKVLDASPVLAFGAPLAAGLSALAITALAVGLGAANARFEFTSPNELVMTPGAFAYMALALAYTAVVTALLARPAWLVISGGGRAAYWSTAEGLGVIAVLSALTVGTAAAALAFGVRQLARTEAGLPGG